MYFLLLHNLQNNSTVKTKAFSALCNILIDIKTEAAMQHGTVIYGDKTLLLLSLMLPFFHPNKMPSNLWKMAFQEFHYMINNKTIWWHINISSEERKYQKKNILTPYYRAREKFSTRYLLIIFMGRFYVLLQCSELDLFTPLPGVMMLVWFMILITHVI